MSVLTQTFFNNAVTGAGGTLFTVPAGRKYILTCVTAWDPGVNTNVVQLLAGTSTAGANIAFILGLIPLTAGYAIKVFDTWLGRLTMYPSDSLVYFLGTPAHYVGLSVTGFDVPYP
ncbi:MAG TPA: hypothetical protein VF969_08240 [Burkholderiales bacterium]